MTDEAVFRKCAWRLVPFMTLLYLVNFIDQVNVGFAALTMNKDLGFTPTIFGFGAGVFFLGYVMLQIPASVIIARFGVRRCVFTILACWGLLSAACSLVRGPTSFYLLRFTLGMAEAGLFPSMVYYLTLWFPQRYRARYTATFVSANALAYVIGAPLSGVILGLDGALGLHGWQWLFLLEGLPAFFLSFAAFLVLPDSPQRTPWLRAEEKKIIASELAREDRSVHSEIWPALSDPRVLMLGVVILTVGSSIYGVRLWLPQIVQAMGFSNFETGFVVAVPFAIAMLSMYLWGRSSDSRQERFLHVASPMLVAAAAFLVASLAAADSLVLLSLCVAVISLSMVIGVYWILPSSFLSGSAAAAGIAFANCNSSIGGFLGPFLIGALKEATGEYAASMAVLAAALLTGALVLLALRRIMTRRAPALAPKIGGRA